MLEIPDEQEFSRLHKSKSLETVAHTSYEQQRRISEPEKEKSSAFGRLFGGKKSKRESIPEEDRIPTEQLTKENQIPQATPTESTTVQYTPAEFLPTVPMFYAMAESSQEQTQHTSTEMPAALESRLTEPSSSPEKKLPLKKRRAPRPPITALAVEPVEASVSLESSPLARTTSESTLHSHPPSLEQSQSIESESHRLEESSSLNSSTQAPPDLELQDAVFNDEDHDLSNISASIQQMPLPYGSPPPKPKRLSLDGKLLLRISDKDQAALEDTMQMEESLRIDDTQKNTFELESETPNLISSEEILSVLAGFDFNMTDQEDLESETEITVAPELEETTISPELDEFIAKPVTRRKSDADVPSLSVVRNMAKEALVTNHEKSVEIKNILRRSMARMMGVSQEQVHTAPVADEAIDTAVTLQSDTSLDIKSQYQTSPVECLVHESPVNVEEAQHLYEPPGALVTDEDEVKVRLEASETPEMKASTDLAEDATAQLVVQREEIVNQPIDGEDVELHPERLKSYVTATPPSSSEDEEPLVPLISRTAVLSRSKSLAELYSPRQEIERKERDAAKETSSVFGNFLKSRRQLLRKVENKNVPKTDGRTVHKISSKSFTQSTTTPQIESSLPTSEAVQVQSAPADETDSVFTETVPQQTTRAKPSEPDEPAEPEEEDPVMQSMKKWKLRRARSIGSLVFDSKKQEEEAQHQAAEEDLKKRTKSIRERTQRILDGIRADRALKSAVPSPKSKTSDDVVPRESKIRAQLRQRRRTIQSTPNLDSSLDAFLSSEQRSETVTEPEVRVTTAVSTELATSPPVQAFPSLTSEATKTSVSSRQTTPPTQVRVTRKVKRKNVVRRSVGTDVINSPESDPETPGYDSSEDEVGRLRPSTSKMDSGFSDISSSHETGFTALQQPRQRISPRSSGYKQRSSAQISGSMTDASKSAINKANQQGNDSGESVPDDIKEFMSLERTDLQRIILQQQQEMRLLREQMMGKQQPQTPSAHQANTTSTAPTQQKVQQPAAASMPFMYMMPTPKGMMPMFYMPQPASGIQQQPGMQMPGGMQMPTTGMQMPTSGMQMPPGNQMPMGMQMPTGMSMPTGMQMTAGMPMQMAGGMQMPGMMPMGGFPFGGMPMGMPGMTMAPQQLSDHSGQSE